MNAQLQDTTIMIREIIVINQEISSFARLLNEKLASGWRLHGPITQHGNLFTAVVAKYDDRFTQLLDGVLDVGVQQVRSMR